MLGYYCIFLLLASSRTISLGINLPGIPPVTLPTFNPASIVPPSLPTSTCDAAVRSIATKVKEALTRAMDSAIDIAVWITLFESPTTSMYKFSVGKFNLSHCASKSLPRLNGLTHVNLPLMWYLRGSYPLSLPKSLMHTSPESEYEGRRASRRLPILSEITLRNKRRVMDESRAGEGKELT